MAVSGQGMHLPLPQHTPTRKAGWPARPQAGSLLVAERPQVWVLCLPLPIHPSASSLSADIQPKRRRLRLVKGSSYRSQSMRPHPFLDRGFLLI